MGERQLPSDVRISRAVAGIFLSNEVNASMDELLVAGEADLSDPIIQARVAVEAREMRMNMAEESLAEFRQLPPEAREVVITSYLSDALETWEDDEPLDDIDP